MAMDEPSPTSSSRAFFPGWTERLIIAVTLLFVAGMRLLSRLDDPPWPINDPAVHRLLNLVFVFFAGLTLWIWFCFLSSYRLKLRLAGMAAPFLVLGGFFAL